ncbi:MAG: hypothetical protein ABIO45_02255 [Burkholderiaceae bacterium]
MKPIILAVGLLSAALLAACGGGGSSGGVEATPSAAPGPSPTPTPTASTYSAQKAWINLFSSTRTWTVTGVGSDSKPYVLTLATQVGGSEAFPVTGVSATKSVFQNIVNDGTTTQTVLNEQYLDAEYRMLGSRVSTDGGPPSCSKTDIVAAVPFASASVGTTGPLYAATTLSDCVANATQLGTSYHTWSLISDAGVVYLCVASGNRFFGEATDRLSETCVETDAAGNLGAKARIKLVLPGFTLTATN